MKLHPKHKELAKDTTELALGFTFVGNFIALGRYIRKWGKEAMHYVRH